MTETKKFDIDFVKIFVAAALESLKIQCQYEARAGKPYPKGKGPELEVAIAGIIGLTSAHFTGSIALCFPEKTYLSIMGGMLGETFESMNQDLEDGATELLNIVFGNAKKHLAEKGHTFQRAIPSILKGKELQVKHMTKAQTILVPFESQGGSFQIEIAIE